MQLEHASSDGTPVVPYHPWLTVNSENPNYSLIDQYQKGVLSYIMVHPGVSLVSCVGLQKVAWVSMVTIYLYTHFLVYHKVLSISAHHFGRRIIFKSKHES